MPKDIYSAKFGDQKRAIDKISNFPNHSASPKETPILILLHDRQRFRKALRLGIRNVAVPLQIGPHPVQLPAVRLAHVSDLHNRLLNPGIRFPKCGSLKIEFDSLILNPLPLPHLIAKMQRRSTLRPEFIFKYLEYPFNFFFSEGHGANNKKQCLS